MFAARYSLRKNFGFTLVHMQIHHPNIDVQPDETHSSHVGWQMLVNVRDGEGVAMESPRLHCHHIRNRIHQPAVIEVEELMDRMSDLDVGNLRRKQMVM